MRLIDLTHPLAAGQPSFPGDPKLAILPHTTVSTSRVNLKQVSMGTHQGTHLDAMRHFLDDGKAIDQMPLDWFYGPARRLRLPKSAGARITVDDLRPHEEHLRPGARILISTGWDTQFGSPRFFEDFPSLTVEAARYLAARNIRLLGMDMPSPGKEWYELHHILLAREVEIVLVESLANLEQLPDEFLFIGFPLRFVGGDGSPIRAVAVCAD